MLEVGDSTCHQRFIPLGYVPESRNRLEAGFSACAATGAGGSVVLVPSRTEQGKAESRMPTYRTHRHGDPPPPVLKGPGPFVDSSNRTEPHARLRLRPASSSYTYSPRKSPPTRTVSLATVTASSLHTDSDPFPAASPASFVPFLNFDLSSEGEELGGCGVDGEKPEPWRRPHTAPRTLAALAPPPTAPISKPRRPKPAKRVSGALADLRFAGLIERSVTCALRERSVNEGELGLGLDANGGSGEFDAQDALLAARLRVALARQGWRRPVSVSPTRWTPAARPTSVLLSGSATSFSTSGVPFPAPPTPTPAPAPPLLVSRARPRSGSNGTPETLPLPALVAALLLRRHNEPHLSLDTGVRARVRACADAGSSKPVARRPSPLSPLQDVCI
ncbi:hypothetical protein FB451DRAFT_1367338 [Mycena latifolia]|nr:hypothetical protein FB451DRAFT_1367338 [Mycena latifolia]